MKFFAALAAGMAAGAWLSIAMNLDMNPLARHIAWVLASAFAVVAAYWLRQT